MDSYTTYSVICFSFVLSGRVICHSTLTYICEIEPDLNRAEHCNVLSLSFQPKCLAILLSVCNHELCISLLHFLLSGEVAHPGNSTCTLCFSYLFEF